MSVSLKSIDERLRATMCPICVRYAADGNCSLPPGRECSLFRNLHKVVAIVRRTHSDRIAAYEPPLRASICAACHHQDDHRCCPKRDDLDCALDTYFPMIVEVIEDELDRQRKARRSPQEANRSFAV